MLKNNNDDNISDISDISNNCSICMSSLKNPNKIETLKCNHIFHKNCINEWFKKQNTCPMCRSVIIQPQPLKQLNVISLPPLISPQIIINNPNNLRNTNSHNFINFKCCKNIRISKDKLLKIISIIMFILTCIFHCASSIYNIYLFFITNNHINGYIKTLNDTQLGDHNHNTYDASVLVCFDISYYFLFIILNIILFKKWYCCCGTGCNFVFLVGLLMTDCIIRSEFIRTTNNFLKDENLHFDASYYNDLMLSNVIFYSSSALKFSIGGITYLNFIK